MQYLSSSGHILVDILSPDLLIALFNVTSASGPAEEVSSRQILWRLINSTSIAQDSRFGLTRSLLSSGSTNQLEEGSLDVIAVEATETALVANDVAAASLVASCVVAEGTDTLFPDPIGRAEYISGHITVDALQTVLALVCTAIHVAVGELLATSSDPILPTAAISVLAAYAHSHVHHLVVSDVYVRAVVSIHHLLFLVPKMDSMISIPDAVKAAWSRTSDLSAEYQAALTKKVQEALAEFLGDVRCRVE